MQKEALFVGYCSFKSKKGNQLYLLEFLTTENVENGVRSEVVSVFVDEATYNSYIGNEIMTESLLGVRIVGRQVFYDLVA